MAIDLMALLSDESFEGDAASVDQSKKLSGKLPAGDYQATFSGAEVKTFDSGPMFDLEFEVAAGDFTGKKVHFKLFMSVKETDADGNEKDPKKIEEQKQRTINQFWVTAFALGLADKKTVNKKSVYKLKKPGTNFSDVPVGTKCVISTTVNQNGYAEVKQFGVSPAGTALKSEAPPKGTAATKKTAPTADLSKRDDLSDLC